jgi:Protein of unknown function (DUF3263)
MLGETEKRTLAIESRWWRYAATKDAAIRSVLDESPADFHRRLGRLVDDPAAAAHAPVLVRRLRRQRARRLAGRSDRRLAG